MNKPFITEMSTDGNSPASLVIRETEWKSHGETISYTLAWSQSRKQTALDVGEDTKHHGKNVKGVILFWETVV